MTLTCGSRTNPSTVMCICRRGRHSTSMFQHLRSDRSIRRPLGKRSSYGRGQIRNTVSIRERPVEADTRLSWASNSLTEGDLVFGTRTSAVATLVDRATRYAMVVALPDGRKADAVARALIEQMGGLPVHLRRSLTWDRGLEMAHHGAITAALSMPVFFCDPHHPWQRGTNENTGCCASICTRTLTWAGSPRTTSTLSRPNSTTAPGGCSAGSPRPKRSTGTSRRRWLRPHSRCDTGLRSWPHDRRASAT